MNGLGLDGEEAEWSWLLPGAPPVAPEAATQTRVRNQPKTLSLSPTNPDLVTTSVMQLCNPIIHFVKDIGVIFDQC